MFREFLAFEIIGAIYLYVLMVLSLVLERWIEFFKRFTLVFWVVALAVVTLGTSSIVVYEEVTSSYDQGAVGLRPPSESRSAYEARLPEARARFVRRARWAFSLLYTAIFAVTFAVSAWIGRRTPERSWPTSIACFAVMFVFFAYMVLPVERHNACEVGTSFLIDTEWYCR